MTDLTGKIIIVTGAGQGIGAATARELANCGAKLVLASLDKDRLTTVADAIKADGGDCIFRVCDVRNNAEVKEVVASAIREYGTVHGLVNNAGTIQPLASIADADTEQWKKCVETHVFGSFHFVKAVLPVMLENKAGTIVNVSSGAAELPLPGWGAYNTSKAALKMFSQVLHQELQGNNIDIFSVKPGTVDTRMQDEIRASKINDIPAANVPKEKLTPPEHPAKAIAYLFTAAAKDIAGMELDVRKEPLLGRF